MPHLYRDAHTHTQIYLYCNICIDMSMCECACVYAVFMWCLWVCAVWYDTRIVWIQIRIYLKPAAQPVPNLWWPLQMTTADDPFGAVWWCSQLFPVGPTPMHNIQPDHGDLVALRRWSKVDELDRRLHEGFLWLACVGLNWALRNMSEKLHGSFSSFRLYFSYF